MAEETILRSEEIAKLVDELVAKGGPTTGRIKANQDPVKVARLLELGWKPEEKTTIADMQAKLEELENTQKKFRKILDEHEEKIRICSIRR